MSANTDFDLGSLIWVKGEIDQTLEKTKLSLAKYSESHDAAELKFAQTHLHQVRGAVEMVGLYSVAKLAEELEVAVGSIERGQASDHTHTILLKVSDAILALTLFLEALVNGAPNVGLKLKPVYRALRLARGESEASGADLFFPQLSGNLPAGLTQIPMVELARTQYIRAARRRFEAGLLRWLKGSKVEGAQWMSQALLGTARTQQSGVQRGFWWAAAALCEGLVDHTGEIDLNLQQLLTRLNLQLRRLSEGGSKVAERLYRDVLYVDAHLTTRSPHVHGVRRAFDLDAQTFVSAPEDDLRLLSDASLARELKDLLAQAKDNWSRVSAGSKDRVAQLQGQLASLAEKGDALQLEGFAPLAKKMSGVIVHLHGAATESVGLEVATALLLLENAVLALPARSGDFPAQSLAMIQRLELGDVAPEVELLDDVSRRAQERLLVTQVSQEIQSNLRFVEQVLDGFFRDATTRSELATIENPLRQIRGALIMLDQPAAKELIDASMVIVSNCRAESYTPATDELEFLAEALSSLGFYIDALQRGEANRNAILLSALRKLKGDDADLMLASPPAATEQTAAEEIAEQLEAEPSLDTQQPHVDVSEAEEINDAADVLDSSSVPPAPPAVPAKPAAVSDAAVDAELLEVYLEEAVEVLQTIASHMAILVESASDKDALTVVRRSFHTLKGSGRMVGLNNLGEVAWSVEQVMNVWLQDERSATPGLLQLLSLAHDGFVIWIDQLQRSGEALIEASEILTLAERLKSGEEPVVAAVEADQDDELSAATAETSDEADVAAVAVESLEEIPQDIVIGPTVISRALFGIFLDEAHRHFATLSHAFATISQHEVIPPELVHAAHTLCGIANTTGFTQLGELGYAIEQSLLTYQKAEITPEQDDEAIVAMAIDKVGALLGEIGNHEWPEAEPQTIAMLQALVKRLQIAPEPFIALDEELAPRDDASAIDDPVLLDLDLADDLAAPSVDEDFTLELNLEDVSASHETDEFVLDGIGIELVSDTDITLDIAEDTNAGLGLDFDLTAEQVAVAPVAGDELLTSNATTDDGFSLDIAADTLSKIASQPYEGDNAEFTLEFEEASSQAVADDLAETSLLVESNAETDDLTFDLDLSESPALDSAALSVAPANEWAAETSPTPNILDDDFDLAVEPLGADDTSLAEVAPQPFELDESELSIDLSLEHALADELSLDEPETFEGVNASPVDEEILLDDLEVEASDEPNAALLEPTVDSAELLPTDVIELDETPYALPQPDPYEAVAEDIIATDDAQPVPAEASPEASNEDEALSIELHLAPEAQLDLAELTDAGLTDADVIVENDGLTLTLDDPSEFQIADVNDPFLADASLSSIDEIDLSTEGQVTTEYNLDDSPTDVTSFAAASTVGEPGNQADEVIDDFAPTQELLVSEVAPLFDAPDEQVIAAEPTLAEEVIPVAKAFDLGVIEEAPAVQDLAQAALDVIYAEPEVEIEPAALLDNPPDAAAQIPNDRTGNTSLQTSDTKLHDIVVQDELDEQLLPIFIEEAQELLPQVNGELRKLRQDHKATEPVDNLRRLLHTLKGSARMAGAMRLGEATHNMETRLLNAGEHFHPQLVDELETDLDVVNEFYDRLLHGEPQATGQTDVLAAPTPDSIPSASNDATAALSRAPTRTAAQPVNLTDPDSGKATIRVRADLVDRLVNQAGEVSISRTRIESEMQAFKRSLLDLTDNVGRLRTQLREIEIQAESQMQSQLSQATGLEGFDPLEFDRFTRLQELTRFMAESVNDVATVQHNLLKNLDESNAALNQQARMTKDLQQELMRVRMVPFGSVSDRLYRLVRQTGKETGKKVNLELKGGRVEIDRSVLEKMVSPFEHMLRNAIDHGLESPDVRVVTGKNEFGEIIVEARQEGNELVLVLRDDGAGLNLTRIREKGYEKGLIKAGEFYTDSHVMHLIFEPGFSTASAVTQLSGRGIGMDVVKSEIEELGGRVEVASEAGRGTTFTIHLPLTLAVTQTVLVKVGDKTYAIPSVMIEQVQELKLEPLAKLYEKRSHEWMNNVYPFHYLPKLIGENEIQPEQKRYNTILLLRSGIQRIALHVDQLLKNQEVVVKNIGPQLIRVAGIAGATVLGNGEIVLIINPLQLAQRRADAQLVEESNGPVLVAPVEVVEELKVMPTVMVVDDSLTVRKITGRLLAREGFQVETAKDGIDALQQLQDIRPAVMLVDVEMPRMDGFELTRTIRANADTKHIPIIMITSRTADKHKRYAFELGVNVFLGKPYQEDELLGNIRRLISENETVLVS